MKTTKGIIASSILLAACSSMVTETVVKKSIPTPDPLRMTTTDESLATPTVIIPTALLPASTVPQSSPTAPPTTQRKSTSTLTPTATSTATAKPTDTVTQVRHLSETDPATTVFSFEDECYDLDSDSEKWVESLIQSDWAEEVLEELDDEKEIYYYIEQNNTSYELEEEESGMEYRELDAVPFDPNIINQYNALIRQLNELIAINLIQVDVRSTADFIIILYDNTDEDLYGLVSETVDGDEYVLALNAAYDLDALHFLHELGHVLALEHPFDDSDGDCIGSTEEYGDETAHIGQTLMAYETALGNTPTFYTDYDILAFQTIYGKKE
tara:strand:- start:416 stop:1393 length:978 start_codon:yes stop_codon:yes gene_type:complete